MLFLTPILTFVGAGILVIEVRRGPVSPVYWLASEIADRWRRTQTEGFLRGVDGELEALPDGVVTVRQRHGDSVHFTITVPAQSPASYGVIESRLRRLAVREDAALWADRKVPGSPRYELASHGGARAVVHVSPRPSPDGEDPYPELVRRISERSLSRALSEFEELPGNGRGSWPDVAVPEPSAAPIPRASVVEARCALIIDDLGEHPELIPAALQIEFPVSYAVIPHLAHTRECAERLHEAGREVMLHLPMEPLSYPRNDPGKLALFRGMSREQVELLTRRALAEVPQARGVNNHMGSGATRDRGLMTHLLTVLKRRRLYFVDSRTAPDSVAYEVALALHVPAAVRQVFLDREGFDPDFTRGQLRLLFDIARARGHAVGIGHWHPMTLAVLKDEAPALAAHDVRLVYAGELVSPL